MTEGLWYLKDGLSAQDTASWQQGESYATMVKRMRKDWKGETRNGQAAQREAQLSGLVSTPACFRDLGSAALSFRRLDDESIRAPRAQAVLEC